MLCKETDLRASNGQPGTRPHGAYSSFPVVYKADELWRVPMAQVLSLGEGMFQATANFIPALRWLSQAEYGYPVWLDREATLFLSRLPQSFRDRFFSVIAERQLTYSVTASASSVEQARRLADSPDIR